MSADWGILSALPPDAETPAAPPSPGPIAALGQTAGNILGGAITGLRAPQEFAVTGLLRFVMENGRVPNLQEWWDVGKKSVQEDMGPGDYLRSKGIFHPGAIGSIEGFALNLIADPLNFVPFGAVAKAARLPQMLRAAGQVTHVNQFFDHPSVARAMRHWFHPDIGKPENLITMESHFSGDMQWANREAKLFEDRIQRGLSVEEDKFLRRYVEPTEADMKGSGNNIALARGRILQEAASAGHNSGKIYEFGEEAVRRDMESMQMALRSGYVTKEQYDAMNVGAHVRREFLRTEDARLYIERLAQRDPLAAQKLEDSLNLEAGFRQRSSSLAERLEHLRTRQDIPEDVRRDLGEILTASHSLAKQEWLMRSGAIRHEFLSNLTQFAGQEGEAGFRLIPAESKRFGPIAGKWMPNSIADPILANRGALSPEWMRQMVKWWKIGKIGLNPVAWGRIITHNLLLGDMFGIHVGQMGRYGQATNAILHGTPEFEEAMRAGLFTPHSYFQHEMFNDLLPMLDPAPKFDDLARKLGGAWQKIKDAALTPVQMIEHGMDFQDQLFKMAVWLERKGMGESTDQAVKYATNAMLDYRKIPNGIRWLSQYGVAPFVSFPYQVSQRLATALWERPAGTISKYGKIFKAVEDIHPMSPQEDAQRRALFPDYMQLRKEGYVRMPWKDNAGRDVYLDAGYVLPFWIPADQLRSAVNLVANVYTNDPTMSPKVAQDYLKGNVLSGPGMLNDMFKAILGINPLSGRKWADEGHEHPLYQTLDYFANSLAPTIIYTAPEQLLRAAGAIPPANPLSQAPQRGFAQVLTGSLLPIKFQATDPRQAQVQKIREFQITIRDIRSEIKRIAESPFYASRPDLRDRAVQSQLDRIRVVVGHMMYYAGISTPDQAQAVTPGLPLNAPITLPAPRPGFVPPAGEPDWGILNAPPR